MKTLGVSPIESLPPEILLEIINYVLLPHKKESILNLCLVSRRFSDIACPILFSRVCLGGFTSFHRHKTSQLKELAKGDTKASAVAKYLSIDYSSSFPNDPAKVFSPLEKVMFKHLRSGIRSFRAITSVSWKIGQYDPSWVTDSIINELAAIPTLRDINLDYLIGSSHIRNLDAFSNLHKLRVEVAAFGLNKVILELGKLLARCPSLTDLDISIVEFDGNASQLFQTLDQTGKPLFLRHLKMDGITFSPDCLKFAIGNLRSLQSLHIYRFSYGIVSEPTIWDILRKERIYIQNLSTDVADDSLLRYLSSFQGMRKFSIMKYSSLQIDLITILQIVIPHHAESLTEFSMMAGTGSEIPDLILSENLVNLLSSVKILQYFGLQLHLAPSYVSMIGSIIQICTKIFLKLQRLVLHTPRMALSLQSVISLPTTNVHDAITQYQPDDLSVPSFEIECEGRVYFPSQEGTFSYILGIFYHARTFK